ncbi:MAG: GNAT family protein [Bacteroidia bacterium]
MEFILRPWTLDDLQSLLKYANNPNIARFMTDSFPHPYTEKDGVNFINKFSHDNPVQVFAIQVNGEAAGGIGIHPQGDIMRLNAELGYWLGEPYWGKGIISEAAKQMIEYGFNTFKINRIYARPYSSNKASQRVLEKSGFRLEARIEKNIIKNGELLDELIYAVRRN